MPADDIDPAPLGDVELALQLRPEAFANLSRNPVFDLSMRQRRLDFQQAFVADEPIGTASPRVIVIGNEADLLHGYIPIELIPIGCLGFDDQAPLHDRGIMKLEFSL